MKEREISLIDLMIDILLHWRGIIIAMLVGGILAGAIGFVRANTAMQVQLEQQHQEQQHQEQMASEQGGSEEDYLRNQLTETQLANVSTVLTYKKLYEEYLEYLQNSELMKMDPMRVARAEFTFRISSEDMEQTNNLQSIYRNLLTGSGLYEWLADEKDMPASVNELISLDISTVYANGNILLAQDTLGVTLSYAEEEGCKELKELVWEYLQSKQKELALTVGEHQLVLLDDSFSYVTDVNLLDKQRSYAANIVSYQTTYAKAADALEEKEKQYYELMLLKQGDAVETALMEDEKESFQTTSVVTMNRADIISSAVKYLILGMLLAAFLYVFMIFVQYIMSSKLRITDNITDIYSIPQLGSIPSENVKNRFLGIVDKWLLKLRNHRKRIFTPQEALVLATTAVKIAAQKNSITQMAVIGCDMKEEVLNYAQQLKASLAKDGVDLILLNNILYDAEAMERLSNVPAAILMETTGSTLYAEVEQELIVLKRQEILILGGIMIEG